MRPVTGLQLHKLSIITLSKSFFTKTNCWNTASDWPVMSRAVAVSVHANICNIIALVFARRHRRGFMNIMNANVSICQESTLFNAASDWPAIAQTACDPNLFITLSVEFGEWLALVWYCNLMCTSSLSCFKLRGWAQFWNPVKGLVDEFLQRKQFDCEASPWASACNERAFPGGLSPQVSTFEFSNLDTTLLSGCLPWTQMSKGGTSRSVGFVIIAYHPTLANPGSWHQLLLVCLPGGMQS